MKIIKESKISCEDDRLKRFRDKNLKSANGASSEGDNMSMQKVAQRIGKAKKLFENECIRTEKVNS